MSIHACMCNRNGRTEWHLRYPGMTEREAQNLVDRINGSMLTVNTSREKMITDMCYTWRHDYGLAKETDPAGYSFPYLPGMTAQEREELWHRMSQVFDNCIAPYIGEFRT